MSRKETDIIFTGRDLLFIVFEQFLENIVWYFFSQRILEFPEKFTLFLERERETRTPLFLIASNFFQACFFSLKVRWIVFFDL